MIEKYTLEPMKLLWFQKDARCRVMLDVELAIIWAREELGQISKGTYEIIAEHADFSMERVLALEAKYDHDVNGFVFAVHEWLAQKGYGEYARYFHDGNTSYDIVDPTLVLMLRKAAEYNLGELRKFRRILLAKAFEYKWSLMIGRTHGEPGEPTTFGHFLLVQVAEIDESIRRFESLLRHELREARMSGALGVYGTVRPDVEELALKHLGLVPTRVSTQILQRSRHARVISEIATTGMVIANICQTFWDMMHMYCRELEEPVRTKKKRGSSAMPHKKSNKIYTERIIGLPRLLVGYEVAALMNILTHEWRAIEQSSVERIVFPDATSLLHYVVNTICWLVENLVVHPQRMQKHLDDLGGLWATQSVMKALLAQEVDRDTAYAYLAGVAGEVLDGKGLMMELLTKTSLSEGDQRTAVDVLGQEQVAGFFDARTYVREGIEHMFSKFEKTSEKS